MRSLILSSQSLSWWIGVGSSGMRPHPADRPTDHQRSPNRRSCESCLKSVGTTQLLAGSIRQPGHEPPEPHADPACPRQSSHALCLDRDPTPKPRRCDPRRVGLPRLRRSGVAAGRRDALAGPALRGVTDSRSSTVGFVVSDTRSRRGAPCSSACAAGARTHTLTPTRPRTPRGPQAPRASAGASMSPTHCPRAFLTPQRRRKDPTRRRG